jgi:hypothetical protein
MQNATFPTSKESCLACGVKVAESAEREGLPNLDSNQALGLGCRGRTIGQQRVTQAQCPLLPLCSAVSCCCCHIGCEVCDRRRNDAADVGGLLSAVGAGPKLRKCIEVVGLGRVTIGSVSRALGCCRVRIVDHDSPLVEMGKPRHGHGAPTPSCGAGTMTGRGGNKQEGPQHSRTAGLSEWWLPDLGSNQGPTD